MQSQKKIITSTHLDRGGRSLLQFPLLLLPQHRSERLLRPALNLAYFQWNLAQNRSILRCIQGT